jgi:hypothetical protein
MMLKRELSRLTSDMGFWLNGACFSVLFEQFDDETGCHAKSFSELAL